VQALSGEGGWPLTAFLTPDGETFFGGTYFPPEEGRGRPSFPRVLREVARVWTQERERALDMARQIRERVSILEQAESQAGGLSPEMVAGAAEEFAHTFDFRRGGFGRAPKFPNAGAVLLMLDRWLDTGEGWALRIVRETLVAMARGGFHDQLGGGFHRYSTDVAWLIPHFEKMAYDNGPLLEAYARAASAAGEAIFREAADGVVAYYEDIAADLLAEGGFPAAQDADIGTDDDGDYWTWTPEEVGAALGDERALRAVTLRFGLDEPRAAMPHDPARHVLYQARTVAEVAAALGEDEGAITALLADAGRRLKAARDQRPRPLVDTNVYVGWASLVATGFLAAARYLERPAAGVVAVRTLDRIWEEAFDVEDGLVHRLGDREAGYLDDQALFLGGLLDAFEYTQRADFLERARAVAVILLARFREADGGDGAGSAFMDRPRDPAATTRTLQAPRRPITDAPAPAGNAVAALGLLRLSALLHDESWAVQARAVLACFAGSAPGMATACATYFRAVDWATAPTAICVVVAGPDAPGDALFRAALATYRPRTVLRRLAPSDVAGADLPPELAAMVTAEAPRAYLCVGNACRAPVATAEAVRELLKS
jgi:hypothetical protein